MAQLDRPIYRPMILGALASPSVACRQCAGTGLVRRPWYWVRMTTPFSECACCSGRGFVRAAA